jgi:UDP-glucose 4-epimerase
MEKLSLVTGGAGFIGSHLAETLLRQGHRVRILDNFSTGLRENLAGFQPAPEIVEADLTDAMAVHDAVADVDVVYHLGALASVQRSVDDPIASHAVCATGTLNVLNAARRQGARRVVYAASSSCYGGASSESGQVEDIPLSPLSPYAAAKLSGEMYAQAFAATYGLETVRVRFFNIFGPRQRGDSPYSGVIAIFVAALLQGRVPIIHGDGLQSRDFTYVSNAVQALIKAGSTAGVSGEVYNIGTGSRVNILELVSTLNKLLGTDVAPQNAPARAGDVRHSRADITKARRELGFEPDVAFEEGLRLTVDWYRTKT